MQTGFRLTSATLAATFLITLCSCSTTQEGTKSDVNGAAAPSLNEVRESFAKHWKNSAKSVKVLEITEMHDGWFRGNGIADQRPVEEFYDSQKKRFTRERPAGREIVEARPDSVTYESFVSNTTINLSSNLPENGRIAVLDFPADRGRVTELSRDLSSKAELALVNSGKHVVDRATLDKVLNEINLQQKEGALFDSVALTRIGKLSGATIVIHGFYSLLNNKQLTLTVKAVATETAKILSVKQENLPLTGSGAENREIVMKLAETPVSNSPAPASSESGQASE